MSITHISNYHMCTIGKLFDETSPSYYYLQKKTILYQGQITKIYCLKGLAQHRECMYLQIHTYLVVKILLKKYT